MVVYPYKAGSESAKVLAEAIGIKRIKHKGSKFKPSPDKTILNWGASKMPEELLVCNIINHPDAVALASNKLKFFGAMDPENKGCAVIKHKKDGGEHKIPVTHRYVDGLGVGDDCNIDPGYTIISMNKGGDYPRVPRHVTTKKGAEFIIAVEGAPVVCRTVLNGNSGEGIVIANSVDELVDAPLYVRYVPKKQEYRVHVLNGEVVDVQRKARRKDVPDEEVNWMVRNHDNGFIFARGEDMGEVPEDVTVQALRAVKVCGLDFGAVDVIYNDGQAKAYVLEVNTAPGLSGATLEGYVERLRNIV
jgi:hypothetical protein